MTLARKHIMCLLLVMGYAYNSQAQIQENTFRQPPELLSPYDEEVVQVNRPLLTWKAPLPILGSKVEYLLVLTELRKGQAAVQALQTNPPLIHRRGIGRTFLPFPIGTKALEVGKTYVWQVSAFQRGQFLGQTDIWEFTYEGMKSIILPPPPVSYPFVKTKIQDAVYQIGSTVYFAYENQFHETSLDYQIIEEGGAIVGGIPSYSLVNGINKIELSLSLIDGKQYTLVIENRLNQVFYLPFIYQTSPTP